MKDEYETPPERRSVWTRRGPWLKSKPKAENRLRPNNNTYSPTTYSPKYDDKS
jgi:hypothetical protein